MKNVNGGFYDDIVFFHCFLLRIVEDPSTCHLEDFASILVLDSFDSIEPRDKTRTLFQPLFFEFSIFFETKSDFLKKKCSNDEVEDSNRK